MRLCYALLSVTPSPRAPSPLGMGIEGVDRALVMRSVRQEGALLKEAVMQSVRQKDEFCLQTLRPATDEDLSNGPAVFKPWRVQLAERREAQMKQRLALPPPLLSLPLVAAESETSAIVVSKPSVDMAMVLRSVRQEAAEPPKIALTWREALAQRRRAALQSPRPALPAPARPLALPTSATPTVPTDNS